MKKSKEDSIRYNEYANGYHAAIRDVALFLDEYYDLDCMQYKSTALGDPGNAVRKRFGLKELKRPKHRTTDYTVVIQIVPKKQRHRK